MSTIDKDVKLTAVTRSKISHEEIGSYANMWVRQKHFKTVGEEIGGHKHNYDHLSILAVGKVSVRVDNVVKIFTAPTFIVVPKDSIHNITALTKDTVWYCIFAHRDVDGNVFDSSNSVKEDPAYNMTDADFIHAVTMEAYKSPIVQ